MSNSIRIEAETMKLVSFKPELLSFASGEQLISLQGSPSAFGTASFVFSGSTGLYNVVVGYFDENDGQSRIEVRKQDIPLAAWDLNKDLGSSNPTLKTSTTRTVVTELSIKKGDPFEIQALRKGAEGTRIDYIEFIPVKATPIQIIGTNNAEILQGNNKDNIIQGFKGNDVIRGSIGDDTLNGGENADTASYSQFSSGIIANLNTGVVLKPLYGTLNPPKIMPLGDSITSGFDEVNPTPGAYRIQLWNNFLADGLNVDFVGSQFNGLAQLGDKNHEGHPGWKMNQITSLVNNGLLTTYRPDVILLTIGTNDALGSTKTTGQMYTDISNLIDSVSAQLPTAQLLVASIPPADPSVRDPLKVDKIRVFNNFLPSLVANKAEQGKKVSFVNAGGVLTVDDLLSDGIHPDREGYNKMGNAWYDALVDRDTLLNIENITGTSFNDKLIGNNSANVLCGLKGADRLTGGGGKDTFVYQNAQEGNDIITDFQRKDRFRISASGFGGDLVAGVGLKTTASQTGSFISNESPTPIGTSANFLYNTLTGLLSFDVDGVGSMTARTIATLSGVLSLTTNNFIIAA